MSLTRQACESGGLLRYLCASAVAWVSSGRGCHLRGAARSVSEGWTSSDTSVQLSGMELEDPRDVDAPSLEIADGLPLAIESMVAGGSGWCHIVALPSELRRRGPSERDTYWAHSLRTCGL